MNQSSLIFGGRVHSGPGKNCIAFDENRPGVKVGVKVKNLGLVIKDREQISMWSL